MGEIPFRIIGMKVEDFRLTTRDIQDFSGIILNTSFAFGVSAKNHIVQSYGTYSYCIGDDELVKLSLICSFDISEGAFNGFINENKFVLDSFFSRYLATINVGAARGEIHAKCESAGSNLSKIILPPINLVEAIPSDVEIELA